MLIFSPAVKVSEPLQFGSGTGRIQLDRLECDGTENLLKLCENPGINVHQCSHLEDVGLICEGRPIIRFSLLLKRYQ